MQHVFGVGVDLAHVPRFGRLLDKCGPRFLEKAFHPSEIQHYHKLDCATQRVQYVASRWALKEAVVKAFGVRLLFPEMYLHRNTEARLGHAGDPRPTLVTEGLAKDLFAQRNITQSFVSISHDHDYTVAYVTLVSAPPLPADKPPT